MTNEEKKRQNGGQKKKLIIVIIVAVFLLLAVTAGTTFFLLQQNSSKEETATHTDRVPVPAVKDAATIGPMIDIEEFVVNIISADTPHYVKASLSLELNAVEARPETEQRMPQIRDAVLLLIGNKTFEELQDLQGKKQLKAELKSRINSFLQTGSVKAIYFTNFVVQ